LEARHTFDAFDWHRRLATSGLAQIKLFGRKRQTSSKYPYGEATLYFLNENDYYLKQVQIKLPYREKTISYIS